jgi:RHS repeat-associated protein
VSSEDRRIGKKINGQLVQGFLYGDDLGPEAVLSPDGSILSRFVYGTSAVIPDYMVKSGTTYRIVSDERYSPRLVVNTETGEIAQELAYDSYGRVTKDTNPGFQPFGFAGGLYDRDTGLTHFGAREYDAETGRFISQDPLDFSGGDTNLYAYAAGDPVNAIDPDGLSIWGDAWGVVSTPFNMAADTITWASYESGITGYANRAAAYYASVATDSSVPRLIRWVANVEGGFASLAACDNAGPTAVTLVTFGGGGDFAAGRRVRIGLRHPADHYFPRHGAKLRHLQINWWMKGVDDSGGVRRIPYN